MVSLNLEVWYSCDDEKEYHTYLCFRHAIELAQCGFEIKTEVTETGLEGDMRSTCCKKCYSG